MDTDVEGTETFQLTLTATQLGVLLPSHHVATTAIIEDDSKQCQFAYIGVDFPFGGMILGCYCFTQKRVHTPTSDNLFTSLEFHRNFAACMEAACGLWRRVSNGAPRSPLMCCK